MSKLKDFFVGLREGTAKGVDIGMLIGLPLMLVSRKHIPKNPFVQGLFNDQALVPPSNPQSKWNKINSFALMGSIAVSGMIGLIAGGVYGLVRGNPNAKEDAAIAKREAQAKEVHSESQKPEQTALNNDEHITPNHTATIQPRETSKAATIASERSAEKPAEMVR